MFKSKYTVYILGPSLYSRGGISSVIKVHIGFSCKRFSLRFIPTYFGKNRLMDFVYFAFSLVKVIFICVMNKPSSVLFHIHSSTGGSFLRKSILLRICTLFRYKVVFHIHGADFDEYIEEIGAKRIHHILCKAASVILLSESWYRRVKELIPDLHNMEILYNPCPNIPDGIEESVCDSKMHCDEIVKIIFTGMVCERKGVYDLIRACNKIRELPFILNIYGNGETKKAISLIKELKLESKIKVSNWVDNINIMALYENSDIFVLPSYQEGMPMSLLEAMSRSLPILGTDIMGIRECIISNGNGFMVEPGSESQIADVLSNLINNREIRQSMAIVSRNTAVSKFSPEVIRNQLFTIYDRTMFTGDMKEHDNLQHTKKI